MIRMKRMNKIQKKIYKEYKKTGKVWADCPRSCGKTELIMRIIEEEVKKGKTVGLFTLSREHSNRIRNMLKERLSPKEMKLVYLRDEHANVRCYDELYHPGGNMNQKHVCLRTRPHPLLTFTWRDMDKTSQKNMNKIKKEIGQECWAREFNNGVIE